MKRRSLPQLVITNVFSRVGRVNPKSQYIGIVVAAGIGVIGVILLFGAHAATSVANLEAEAGTLTNGAVQVTDSHASGGKAVKFPAASGSCTLSAIDVPSCGALWGAYVPGSNALFTLEGKVGRTFNIFQSYQYFNSNQSVAALPIPQAQTYFNNGQRIMYITLVSKLTTGQDTITWADIADGDWDTQLKADAASLKQLAPHKVFLAFDAEFEIKAHASANGTPAEYVAAYQHIYQIMHTAGANNIIWVWDSQGSFDAPTYQSYYPGDNYVDWIGWDPYNHAGSCTGTQKGWKTNYSTFNSFYNLIEGGALASVTTGGGGAHAAQKPMLLGEYGSVEANGQNGTTNDPTLAPQWYTDIPGNLQDHFPNIKALMMWDSGSDSAACVTVVNGPSGGVNPPTDDSTQATLDAFKAAGLNPYVNHTYTPSQQ